MSPQNSNPFIGYKLGNLIYNKLSKHTKKSCFLCYKRKCNCPLSGNPQTVIYRASYSSYFKASRIREQYLCTYWIALLIIIIIIIIIIINIIIVDMLYFFILTL